MFHPSPGPFGLQIAPMVPYPQPQLQQPPQPEVFSIRWKGYGENLFTQVGGYHNNPEFSDVVLASEDGVTKIQCHKLVLASASNYIRHLLIEENDSSVIILPDVSGEVLKLLTRYMYFGEVSVHVLMIQEFVEAAKNLGLKGLDMAAPRSDQYNNEASALSFLSNAAATFAAAHQQRVAEQHHMTPPPPPPPPTFVPAPPTCERQVAAPFANGLSMLAQAALSPAKLNISRERLYNYLPATADLSRRLSLPGGPMVVRKRLPSSESSTATSSGMSYMTGTSGCNDENSPLNQDDAGGNSAINLSVKKEQVMQMCPADSPSPIDMTVHAFPQQHPPPPDVTMLIKQQQQQMAAAAAMAMAQQHQEVKTAPPAKKRRTKKQVAAAAAAAAVPAASPPHEVGQVEAAQAAGPSAAGGNGTEKWKSRQPRPCDHCDRIFSNKFNLKQHIMNMHTPGGTVSCELCKKRVKNKWYLRRHQVTHHNAPLKK